MNTTDKNTLIAEFMKWDILNDITYSKATKGKWIELDKLKFHSNWNWLMEVVEKIESLGYYTQIDNIGCVISHDNRDVIVYNSRTKIEAVYNACIAFIEWYNKQNKL